MADMDDEAKEWIVCWHIDGTSGRGMPQTATVAGTWARLGNKSNGPGTHWVVRLIEGGRE